MPESKDETSLKKPKLTLWDSVLYTLNFVYNDILRPTFNIVSHGVAKLFGKEGLFFQNRYLVLAPGTDEDGQERLTRTWETKESLRRLDMHKDDIDKVCRRPDPFACIPNFP